jgi:hypothetical protein
MKKILFFLISLIFPIIGNAQLSVNKVISQNSNKLILINVIVDTLESNETNTFEILSATAKNNDGQIIKSSEIYPGGYYRDDFTQIIFESQFKPIYSLDSLKVKIKYFTPTEENKSLIKIHNPLQKFGLNLIGNEYPKMKFILLDFFTLQDLERNNKKEYINLIEKIEEDNKVVKNSIASFVNRVIQKFRELKLSDAEFKKRLLIYIEDEERQIQKISTQDENGMNMEFGLYNIWSESFTSLMQTKSCTAIPENTWTITLCIENEKSTKEIELKMENLVIPREK